MNPGEHPPVIITAAGEGSRIRDYMSQDLSLPDDYPKHLLPTGGLNGETLLGRIIRQASIDPISKPPVVNVSEANLQHMSIHPDIADVEFDTEQFKFSLDPIYYRLRRMGGRVLGCAGDFYSDFCWDTFIKKHEASGAAMSVLVNKAAGPVEAAVFDVDPLNDRVTSLKRPKCSGERDYTNIGAYVIDPTEEVVDILDKFLPDNPEDTHDTDTIFVEIMAAGLVGSVIVPGAHFNINTPKEFEALQAHTSSAITRVS